VDIGAARFECRVLEYFLVQRNVGMYTVHDYLSERGGHARNRRLSVLAMSDEFADQ
jgi:hypothetical protein